MGSHGWDFSGIAPSIRATLEDGFVCGKRFHAWELPVSWGPSNNFTISDTLDDDSVASIIDDTSSCCLQKGTSIWDQPLLTTTSATGDVALTRNAANRPASADTSARNEIRDVGHTPLLERSMGLEPAISTTPGRLET